MLGKAVGPSNHECRRGLLNIITRVTLLFLAWVANQMAGDLIDAFQNQDVHGSQSTSAEIVGQSGLSQTQQKSVL